MKSAKFLRRGMRRPHVTAVLVMALASIAYLGVTLHMIQSESDLRARARVEADIRAIHALDGFFPVVSVIAMLERRNAESTGDEYYMVRHPDGDRIAGNLVRWPQGEPDAQGWVRLNARETGAGPALARVAVLDGTFPVLVGRRLQAPGTHPIFSLGFFALMAACVVIFTAAASVLAARRWRSRVADVNAVFQAVERDQLDRRVEPVGGDDELSVLADHVNRALDRIEIVVANHRTLADQIAHELKKPLARARLALDRPGEMDAAFEDVRAAIDEAVSIFDTILITARMRAASEASRTPEDLKAMVEAVIDLFAPAAEMKGVTLTAPRLAPLSVLGARMELRLMLVNLVDNALKFTPPGGHVRVETRLQDDGVRLAVLDTGPGLKAFPARHADQPFVRGPLDAEPGVGLGLALVAVVAAHHGAALCWSDRVEGGARVEVTFPPSRIVS